MKKYTSFYILGFCSNLVCSLVQAQDPLWVNHFGNNGNNLGLQLTYDGYGGIYGLGTMAGPTMELDDTTLSVLGIQDIFIAKWDTSGVLQWARTAGGVCVPSEFEYAGSITHDGTTGQTIISGQFHCSTTYFGDHVLTGSQSDGRDRFIAAYGEEGECSWAEKISGYEISIPTLLTDSTSNVFAIGWSRIAPVFFHSSPIVSVPPGGFIAKYSPSGTLLDASLVVVNGELNRADWVTSDTWVLAGSAKPNATLYGQGLTVHSVQHDGFVAKSDTSGVVEWVTMFPSSGSANVFSPVVLSNGKIAVSGYFVEDLLLPQDTLHGIPGVWTYFVALLNQVGEFEWVQPMSSDPGAYMGIRPGMNGDILLYGRYGGILTIGSHTMAPYASASGFVARLSQQGECKAAWGFGRTHYASGSILSTDHGLYLSSGFDSTLVLGSFSAQASHSGPQPGPHDLFIARFDSLSGFTSVPTLKSSVGERLHIYANPNNGLCTIELPAAVIPGSDMVLTIHDAMGRVVQQAPLRWSEGTIQLDIRAQAKGIYYAELLDGKQRYSGTIVFE